MSQLPARNVVELLGIINQEARGGAFGSGIAPQGGSLRVRLPMGSLGFFIDLILPIDSVSSRNEYQEYFLWDKGCRCVGLTNLPPSCADYLEIWEPQPFGTLRARPGLYRDCFTLLVSQAKQTFFQTNFQFLSTM